MAMVKRKRHAKQASMWVATQDLPRSTAPAFYARLNQISTSTAAIGGDKGGRARLGLDVLVQSKQVRRIVSPFDLDETVVIASIALADTVFAFLLHEVDVRSPR